MRWQGGDEDRRLHHRPHWRGEDADVGLRGVHDHQGRGPQGDGRRCHRGGPDQPGLWGGSGVGDTARAAKANLRINCSNKTRCDEDRDALAEQLARAAKQVASVPVESNGTDILAATRTALAICGGNPCRITHISDGGDSRLLEPLAVEELVKKYLPAFPTEARGQVVHIVGLGADGSDNQFVDRAEAFWSQLLAAAGAVDVRIGRSL